MQKIKIRRGFRELWSQMCCHFFHILRVHYGWEMDCFILQGSVSTLFRWGGHIFTCVCIVSSCLQQCKNYKNRVCFSRAIMANVLPRFFGPQCIFAFCRTATAIRPRGNGNVIGGNKPWAADGWPVLWVNRPLQVNQPGQLSLSSLRGR